MNILLYQIQIQNNKQYKIPMKRRFKKFEFPWYMKEAKNRHFTQETLLKYAPIRWIIEFLELFV